MPPYDFLKKITYFWLSSVFTAVCGLSLVAVSRGYSSLQCMGFSLWWLLLLWSTDSRHTGLQQLQHKGSMVAAFGFWSGSSVVVAQGL